MQYYLMFPGDREEDAFNEANLLGESSFDIFWAGSALTTLMTIVDQEPELLSIIQIKTDAGVENLSIEKFLKSIQKLKIRTTR
jgi:hypothetical protein